MAKRAKKAGSAHGGPVRERPATRRTTASPPHSSDGSKQRDPPAAAESLVYQILNRETRFLCGCAADAIERFCQRVRLSMSALPDGTFVSVMEVTEVIHAWDEVCDAVNDATLSLCTAIDHFGTVSPILKAEIPPEVQVERPQVGGEVPDIPSRARHSAKLLGYFTRAESQLHETLRSLVRTPRPLERTGSVHSLRHPFISAELGDGRVARQALPLLAWPEEELRQHFPLLARSDMTHYALAVSAASMNRLAEVAAYLRTWRPTRVRNRTLDPNWPALSRTYFKIINSRVAGEADPKGKEFARSRASQRHTGMKSNDSAAPNPPADDGFRSATWFKCATSGGIYPDLLKSARRRARLSGDQRGERWYYLIEDVAALWPQYGHRIQNYRKKSESDGTGR